MTIQDWLGADNTLGIDIWERKYRNGNETFHDWLNRICAGNDSLKQLILEKKFLFGGRILSNRGLGNPQSMSDSESAKHGKKITYSNCYVTTVNDSIESIYDTCRKLARTFSYGGGSGVDISKLAPRGARVNNAADSSTGAVSFMDTFEQVAATIGQSGRRGAMMLSMSCKHPDILEFIDAKMDINRLQAANISVRVTNDFMESVKHDKEWELRYERPETGEVISRKMPAKNILHKIAEAAWEMGEPGVLFWDRISEYNLLSNTPEFEYAGVNPCGEEPLPAGGSCLLGSLNLSAFVDDDGNFDFDSLADAVFTATIALNEVLDEGLPLHPLEEQRKSVSEWRQIGLGVMGISDMFIKMGVRYGSNESVRLSESIVEQILCYALFASCTLAQANGAYPHFNYEHVSRTRFYQTNVSPELDQIIRRYGLRNSQFLTIAPTGTISNMLGVSGGIEPIFANSYMRKTQSLHGEEVFYKVHTPIVKEYMDNHGLSDESELPEYFVTAQSIPYQDRLEVQAAWQHAIDASISSTVNLPESATIEDIENVFLTAYDYGLKGVTVFRSGCKRAGVLTTSDKPKETQEEHSKPIYSEIDVTDELPRGFVIDASDNLIGKKRKLITGCGSLHCEAFFDPITGDLMETFLNKGSTGGCNNSLIGLSRMISLSARSGCSIEAIVDQLNSCGTCSSYAVRRATKHDTSEGACCPIAVGRALVDMHNEMLSELNCEETDDEPLKPILSDTKAEWSSPLKLSSRILSKSQGLAACPDCGSELIFEGGCNTCKNCGWSRCN